MDKNLFYNLTHGNFHQRLFAFMESVGMKEIHISYSGGGDSGGMDDMNFFYEKKTSESVRKNVESIISEELEEELCNPIYNRHGSFADGGGFSVNGLVNWSCKNKCVSISGTDHYYSWDDETGESETNSDEDWEDVLYDENHTESSAKNYDADMQFVYMYSKVFGKLPDEFHNRMLIEATNDDPSAKKYIADFTK